MTVKHLIENLRKDAKCEGDVSDYSSQVVSTALRAGYLVIAYCDRPYKNMRLTRKGVDPKLMTVEWEKQYG